METVVRKCKVCGVQYPSDFAQPCEVDFSDDWNYWCQKHERPAEERGCEDCAYSFDGELYFDAQSLGAVLFANWSLGKRDTTRRRISEWLLEGGGDKMLAGTIREIERDESLVLDDRFSLIVTLLISDKVFRWRGSVIDLAWFRHTEGSPLDLLRGSVPKRLAELGLGTWLCELKTHWESIVSQIATEPDVEKTALGLLFNHSNIHSLSTALGVAALIPRLLVADSWKGGPRTLAAMAASVGYTGFTIADNARLKALFTTICRGLRDGHFPLLNNKAFYEATLILAWRYDGKTLLEEHHFREPLLEHLRSNCDSRLLRSLIFEYFRNFCHDKPAFVSALASLIREYLSIGTASEFSKWQALDESFGIFGGLSAPATCAQKLIVASNLEESLRNVGLTGSSIWEGFSAEVLLAWIRSRGRYGIDDWPHIHNWFERSSRSLAHREHAWVEVVVAAWSGETAPGEIQSAVSRYLVDRFGEPDNRAPMWEQCSGPVCETVKQWLLFENLEKFFDLIADYAETTGGEMRSQWGYRRAFWLAVHRTGAVSEIRIAVGRGIVNAMGDVRLKDLFGSKLAKLDDTDERRCALLLRLNELTIVDYTHNAKCRVWRTKSRQNKWFSSVELLREEFQDRQDMKIRSHYSETGISHFNSESYGWQDAVADFLRTHSKIVLKRFHYEYQQTPRPAPKPMPFAPPPP